MAETGTICGSFGAVNPADNNYCGRCGTFLGKQFVSDGERWIPTDRPGEPRARAQSRIIFGIVAVLVLACGLLSLVVIVWRP